MSELEELEMARKDKQALHKLLNTAGEIISDRVSERDKWKARAEAAERKLATAREALKSVRRTDYISGHLNCRCYICQALTQIEQQELVNGTEQEQSPPVDLDRAAIERGCGEDWPFDHCPCSACVALRGKR